MNPEEMQENARESENNRYHSTIENYNLAIQGKIKGNKICLGLLSACAIGIGISITSLLTLSDNLTSDIILGSFLGLLTVMSSVFVYFIRMESKNIKYLKGEISRYKELLNESDEQREERARSEKENALARENSEIELSEARNYFNFLLANGAILDLDIPNAEKIVKEYDNRIVAKEEKEEGLSYNAEIRFRGKFPYISSALLTLAGEFYYVEENIDALTEFRREKESKLNDFISKKTKGEDLTILETIEEEEIQKLNLRIAELKERMANKCSEGKYTKYLQKSEGGKFPEKKYACR